MSGLVAVDLDQTVLFSRPAGRSVVVEHLDGAPLSSMTVGAVAAYRELAARALLVPVTTRTVEQFSRIALPVVPRHAVCANGGVLLLDGARDLAWQAWVRELVTVAAPLPDVVALLPDGAPWVRVVRTAEHLFAYVVAHDRAGIPPDWAPALAARLEPLGWRLSLQGRKAYAVPAPLTKGAAVARLAALLGVRTVSAAGDSLLDAPLLELALATGGVAVRPAHGELHARGWSPAGLRVTRACGPAAGEELLRLLAG